MSKYKSQLPMPASKIKPIQVQVESKNLKTKKQNHHKDEEDKNKDDAFLITFNIEKEQKQSSPAKQIIDKGLIQSSSESIGNEVSSLARNEGTKSEAEFFKLVDRVVESNNNGVRNVQFSNYGKQNKLLSMDKNTANKRRSIDVHNIVKSSS